MKTVPVLALPRSGSSLLSGILHKLGVYMGPEEDLKKGKYANEHGCYENQDFLSLNLTILAKAGGLGITWIDNYKKDDVKEAVESSENRIKKVINKHERKIWGWKDASAHNTLPYLHKYLKNPHYIYLKRDVEGVVKSQIKTSEFNNWPHTIKHSFSLFRPRMLIILAKRWLKMFLTKGNKVQDEEMIKDYVIKSYERCDEFVKDKKCLKIKFDDLINNSEETIQKIINFLNINPGEEQRKKALKFVHPELVHF